VGLLHDVTPRSGNGSFTRCHFSPRVVVVVVVVAAVVAAAAAAAVVEAT